MPEHNDFAVAISVYDKFDDVRLIVDIIRRNWKGKFYIAVCSSHRNPWPHLEGCDIDEIILTDDIPLDRERYTSAKQFNLHFMMRVVNSVQKGCRSCTEKSGAPYSMHIHADAYPLSWERIQALIQKMERQNKSFAARGDGFGLYSPSEPLGAFDDMFFIFNNAFSKKVGLWDFEMMDFLPHKLSVHGCLSLVALMKAGLKNFYHYKAYDEIHYWDSLPVHQPPLNSSRPMSFDPEYAFLHIHESDFPGDLGRNLKAYYFQKYGISEGKSVQGYLKEWAIDEKNLMERLRSEEDRLQAFFKSKGLQTDYLGRNFSIMETIIAGFKSLSIIGKARWLFRHYFAQLRSPIVKKIKKNLHLRSFSFVYHDCVWPNSLKRHYESNLHVPEGLKSDYLKLLGHV